MDKTKDKLIKAYDVITAFQDWFDKHNLFFSDDEQIKAKMDKLMEAIK